MKIEALSLGVTEIAKIFQQPYILMSFILKKRNPIACLNGHYDTLYQKVLLFKITITFVLFFCLNETPSNKIISKYLALSQRNA